MDTYPPHLDAPPPLLALNHNCGPMSVWWVLWHLRKRASADRIIRLCHHSRRTGSHTIALALALRAHGLTVDFRTGEDPSPTPLERRLYRRAERLGMVAGPALSVAGLLGRVRRGEVAVVLFNTDDGDGHFSPLIGVQGRRLILPYTSQGGMDARTFRRRWTAPGICQQCVLVRR
jgi:hypothetical protein